MGWFTKAKPVPVFSPSTEQDLCPRDPLTGKPLQPTAQPGYYPGFSTMSQKNYWERATREVVETRVKETPPRKFFTEAEWQFWTAVFGHLLPQTDRTPERQIPLVAPLDDRLAKNETDGYRYEDMPEDRVAYRLGIEAINEEAQAQFGADFRQLAYLNQEHVLQALHDGEPKSSGGVWKKLAVKRFWELIVTDAVKAYYAHPWSWDEIGFGGPAYPRAYTRLERGEPEPWEVEEQRYAWRAPALSLSDKVENDSEHHLESEQTASSTMKRSK